MASRVLFRGLTLASFLACYVTIIVGGSVIASGSGLGCPSWPLCGSQPWPTSFTGAAAVEFSHRASAFVLSVLVLATAIVGLLGERERPALQRLAYSSLAIVLLEAILGGVVVDSALTLAIVLVHFAIATVLFALLLLLAALANLPSLPRRWREWARYAVAEHPVDPAPPAAPAPRAPPAPAAVASDRAPLPPSGAP